MTQGRVARFDRDDIATLSVPCPQTIGPGEQMWLNFADLIHHGVPDRKGNMLPADVTSGTYDLEDLKPGLGGNLIEGKVALDKTFGHLTYGCLTCCGYTPYLSPNPVNVTVGGSDGILAFGTNNCTGVGGFSLNTYYNQTGRWSSDNTSIAQVTAYQAQGVAPGTTMGRATATIPSGDGGRPKNPCPQLLQEADAPVPVAPTITGSNAVWWFNGQNPDSSSYPTSVMLTSSGGSSTTWSVTQADTKVSLSSTSGQSINVTSTGSHFSGAVGDISITAIANNVMSVPFTMTARTPWKLVPNESPTTFCNASPLTYGTEITYDVIDNLGSTISGDIGWNESVGTAGCQNGSNWCNYKLNTSGGFTNPLTDILAPPQLNANPAPAPTPTCTGGSSGATRYLAIPQIIYVGSTNTGGVQAQSDTLGYYIDHGQHDSIQIPNKPPQ